MKATIIIIIGLFIIAATLSFLKLRSKGRTANKTDFSSEEYERYYEAKEAALERILGPMHNMVGHAFISCRRACRYVLLYQRHSGDGVCNNGAY